MTDTVSRDTLKLTVQIIVAYVRHTEVASDALPGMIRSVHHALSGVGATTVTSDEARTPAVPVKRSVFPDFIICLEDGKKLKMLKRHLQRSFGLSPANYRAKWGLPRDYPMVAPNYASHRSTLAKSIGLGRKAPAETGEPVAPQSNEPEVTVMPARRARGSKS